VTISGVRSSGALGGADDVVAALILRPVALDTQPADGRADPWAWRWLLIDATGSAGAGGGRTLADHAVTIDPDAWQFRAFADLDRYLWANADPDRRLTSETAIVEQVGRWVGAHLLGPRILQTITRWAPATVTVDVPPDRAVLPQWPWELAHSGPAGDARFAPLAREGVTLVYDLGTGAGDRRDEPVGDAPRMLAVFSQPTSTGPLALRRERYALVRLVRELAARKRSRIELRVLQYGVTRQTLADTAREAGGWDVLHLSSHGGVGSLALEHPDGTPDLLGTADLIRLLRPARPHVKFAVVSACHSAAATAAETLRWLGLDEPAQELEAQAAAAVGNSGGGLARGLADALDCAVLAMRYPVGDEFAIRLSDAFYTRLFDAGQAVDVALGQAVADAAGTAPTPAAPPASVATPVLLGRSAAGLSLRPPRSVGEVDVSAQRRPMTFLPAEPERFVGRTATMSRASGALASRSGRTGVLFHGMAGAGKTACAVELAYRHEDSFAAFVYWEAPERPDDYGAALPSFALALERQLPGFTIVENIGTAEQTAAFAPRLAELCERNGLFIVLDNVETLLTPGGAWRDDRWPPLIGALTGHGGLSRVVLTSRTVPAGLGPGLLIEPVHALPRDDATLLARELPGLRALLHADQTEPGSPRATSTPLDARQVDADRTLVRRVMAVVQGHPKLLELADAAARAGRGVLEARTAAAEREAAVRGEALAAFFRDGESVLDAGGFFAVLSGWVGTAVAGLPEPAGLALRVVCCLEDDDRTVPVLAGNWADIWRRLGLAGDAPPVGVMVGVLAEAALVALDSAPAADSEGGSVPLVGLRVHPGVAEAVRAATPPPVRDAVDEELAAFWRGMFDAARGRVGGEDGRLVAVAGVSAAPYLLRLQEWDQAGYLLEQAFFRDRRNPGMAQAVLPALRRVAEATGTPAGLVRFGRVLAVVDPAGGERVVRQAHDRAVAGGDFTVASAAAGDLVNLLRGQGRLAEALAVADTKVEHTRRAGLGRWAQALDETRRLQILYRMGDVERVLAVVEGPAGLLARLDALPERRDPTDTVNPWNVRETVLNLGALAARDLGRWEEALAYNARVHASVQARGGSAHEIARNRFNDYYPLLRLGRLEQADRLLAGCQQAFTDTDDIPMLGKVFSARADLADERRRHADAVRLEQTAVRLKYIRADPAAVAVSHHNLGNHLTRAGVDPAGALAHHLAAATLRTLVGNTRDATDSLRGVADDLTTHPTLTPPAGLAELAAVVEHTEGVRFTALIDALCPDRAAADQTIRDLLATITDPPATDVTTTDDPPTT
jgi:CHAT domain